MGSIVLLRLSERFHKYVIINSKIEQIVLIVTFLKTASPPLGLQSVIFLPERDLSPVDFSERASSSGRNPTLTSLINSY